MNNVGGSDEKGTQELLSTSDDHFRAQIELNLMTAFQGAKAAASRMPEGGAIVNIASGAGMRASPRTGPYAAAKAGMLNLTETLATELAPRAIRVNAVSPGPVPTEAFVEMLNNNGVEYIFLNSGTDNFPVLESIQRMVEQERAVPQIILCIDEATAMFAAHGYYQNTGHAQVVLVHVDAGTINIGGAYHDAQRDRAAILVCAGRAPSTFGGVARGGKDMNIHWIQEQPDQNGIVRTFTKWDYEVRNNESLNWVMTKAFQVAEAEPAGPVYLTLPRELLIEEMQELQLPPAGRHHL